VSRALGSAGRPRVVLDALRRDYFLWALFAVCAVLTVRAPERMSGYASLVDWRTVEALAGMLVLTKGIELSGYLHRLAQRLIDRVSSERMLGLFLVTSAAVLSMAITNDVALFVLVPLTVSLRAIARVPVTKLVVFEALAVNAGSALTPIGNPQNLFLWQSSGVPFHRYLLAMTPAALCMLAPLFLLTVCAFRSRRAAIHEDAPLPDVRRALLWVSLALYVPFLVLVELRRASAAMIAVLAVFLVLYRSVLLRVDWLLVLTFVLMFIDLRLVATLPFVQALLAQLQVSDPRRLYFTAIGASQLISNVPAAILLAKYSENWRVIACGVNAGGFGLLIASLANVIAMRMAGDRRFWLVFHAYSLPFLGLAAALVYFTL
jgi:di/tricarboxylate transporter